LPRQLKKPILSPYESEKTKPQRIFKVVKAYLKEGGQALINLCSKPKSCSSSIYGGHLDDF
jgi:hypothetical protein